MSVKAISPDEVTAVKMKIIPDQVIDLWNKTIAQNYSNGASRILQKDIISTLTVTQINGTYADRASIFKLGWLEIEDIYRKAGWKVEYDRPGYNENYDAVFIFRK